MVIRESLQSCEENNIVEHPVALEAGAVCESSRQSNEHQTHVQSSQTGSDLIDLFHDALVRYAMTRKCFETVLISALIKTLVPIAVMTLLTIVSSHKNK
jgi:hypothetical protein